MHARSFLPAAVRALAAPARAAPAPARGLAVLAGPLRALFARAPHVFFVKRAAGSSFVEVEVAAGASVAALVEAAVVKLRIDAPPDAVELALAAGGTGAPPLDTTLALDAALAAGALTPRAKLLMTVHALSPPPPPPSAPLPPPPMLPPPSLPSPLALIFLVQRAEGRSFVEVEVTAGASVAALVKAAIAELRLDVSPDAVELVPVDGGTGAPPLNATLAVGALAPHAKLLLRSVPLSLATFSNVISRGPDDSLDAGMLSLLIAADTTPHVRIRALGALVDDVVRREPAALGEDVALPVFETVTHASLIEILTSHARSLSRGVFTGSNGSACRVLVGPRGIGKTAMMRAFAAVAASAFHGVMPLYVSGEAIFSLGSFRDASLRDLIVSAVRARGVDVASGCTMSALRGALACAQLRVLVLLDEVDELYRVVEADGAVFRHVRETLGVLSDLAGGTSGLFGVLACGSSASTHALIRADVAHLADRFPLVRYGVPDLNDTKFQRRFIATAPCGRSSEAVAILTALAGRTELALPADVRPLARLLTFFVGVTPRAILSVAEAGDAARAVGVHLSLRPTRMALSADALALFDALLARLCVANAHLRELTRARDGTVHIEALMDPKHDWEALVTPLEWPAVEAAWSGVRGGASGRGSSSDSTQLARLVADLADAHVVHLEHSMAGGGGVRLWPVTAAQVVAAGAPPAPDAAEAFLERLGKAAAPAVQLLREVCVQAAAAVIVRSVPP
jgi:hypothetical protein